MGGSDMHAIEIDIDTLTGYHPPKVVVSRNGNVLVDMPGDEFISWLERLMRKDGQLPELKP
jgi:hypothetical protein